ncbi:MAG: hypothetical protein JOZ03_04525 [Gammaproteobacteria bacterium]|nr:hypothetical protein [Gammaproteobacteria bacterium]
MRAVTEAPLSEPRQSGAGPRSGVWLRHLVVNVVALSGALGLYLAHEHWAAVGARQPALLALVGAALLAFVPLRSVLGVLFRLESHVMHLLHGVGGLALATLLGTGVISGTPLATHAALAPFAIMGAAQAVMHQAHPRNPQQAEALRRFAASLPEVEQFTRGDLTSPANAARAVVVLRDLIGKAETLGYTELDADPGFQGALRQASTHLGLTLGLDQIQKVVNRLASNPAAAAVVPDLEARLARARRAAESGTPSPGASRRRSTAVD